jgi:integrase
MAKIDHLLTGTDIRKLSEPAEGNEITYDGGAGSVPGFGIRVTAKGAKSFILNYRTRSGRERRHTIGSWPDWTATDARAEARRLRRLIDDGGDPLADIEAEREAPTVSDLIDRFETEHLTLRRAGTARDYRSAINLYIRPHFKNRRVAEVTFADCDQLHHKISAAGHRRRANTVIAILCKVFNLAARWGMRPDGTNPCKGIERNGEVKRRRYLKGDELARLTQALAKYPDKQAADVFRLLLLTGSRRGEVLTAKWADIDLTAGLWSRPASSTKQKQDHEIPLNAPARQLLSEIRERQMGKHRILPEFVFPGHGATKHIVEVKRAWRTICRSANLTDLRIHDLRHSYASELVSSGASLPLVGALLGHASPTTTARYAHLKLDPLRRATERVGAAVEAAANGKPASPAVPLLVDKRRRHRA